MPISVTCPRCDTKLRVKDEAAGLKARCPKCRSVINIPNEIDSWETPGAMESNVLDAQVVGGTAAADEEDLLSDDELGEIEQLRPCPICGESIKQRARFCRYCDEEFERPKDRDRSGRRQPRSRQEPTQVPEGGKDTIVTCDCGAAVRVPPERLGKQFACPQCQRGIALTVDGVRLPVKTLPSGGEVGLCQICQTKVTPGEEYVECLECQQVHHSECWAEVGGCGTYGCKQAPIIDKPNAPSAQPTSAWGDNKECPICRRTIKAVALRCRYCKTDFESADPMSRRELRARRRAKQEVNQLKTVTVVVFIFSLFGCTSPFMLLAAAFYLYPKREEIARSGPLFAILIYLSLAISALFTLLIGGALIFQAVSS
ncbi:MAG: hypothetical protein KDA88_14620 [Planctomycetaceae bacterium]|nr:hypothetical protein [Planctomycetaceae bacterium]MCB9950798.1 hypothetical protein [Planctomycetaceae bacterium]